MLNKNLLRSKQALFGDTDGSLAQCLEITPQTFSLKINEKNGAQFNVGEMRIIRNRYNLTDEEFTTIFFAE